jgi:hypothetical protein
VCEAYRACLHKAGGAGSCTNAEMLLRAPGQVVALLMLIPFSPFPLKAFNSSCQANSNQVLSTLGISALNVKVGMGSVRSHKLSVQHDSTSDDDHHQRDDARQRHPPAVQKGGGSNMGSERGRQDEGEKEGVGSESGLIGREGARETQRDR